MIKKCLFIALVLSGGCVYGQVGINNTNPKSTFHVIASKTDGTTAEGIIAPNLTRSQLITKDGQYGSDQRGAIVYVTTIDGTVTTKTTNVTLSGYYYFNGTEWVAFRSEPWQVQGSTIAATSNAENIYQTGSVAVGSNSAGSYKFQVTGASNITGASHVGSSTVAGDEIVGGTLGVTGATTLANTLAVTGNSALTGSVGIGIASPEEKLHVVGNQFTSGISKLGGTTTYNPSAQLELSDNNKGFLPNRVALTSLTLKAPVTNAIDGMIVYNTTNQVDEELVPGLYYWRDTSWRRMVDMIPRIKVNLLNLQSNITVSTGGTNVLNGQKLTFEEITIPEDGSYAFSYRLYGTINAGGASNVVRIPFYIGVVKNNTVILDAAELDLVVAGNNDYSYSVTLSGSFSKGDKVTTWMTRNNADWILKSRDNSANPVRTSMIYWKL